MNISIYLMVISIHLMIIRNYTVLMSSLNDIRGSPYPINSYMLEGF